jgi:hypothetical protein
VCLLPRAPHPPTTRAPPSPALQAESLKAWQQAPGHLLLADQAGSGKTLAYLLPLVQEMRRAEQRSGRATTSCSPQVVVLTPTAELAQQVRSWAGRSWRLPLASQLLEQRLGQRSLYPGTSASASASANAPAPAPAPDPHPQVQRVARALSSNGAPFRSFLMTGGEADDKERAKKVGGGQRGHGWVEPWLLGG